MLRCRHRRAAADRRACTRSSATAGASWPMPAARSTRAAPVPASGRSGGTPPACSRTTMPIPTVSTCSVTGSASASAAPSATSVGRAAPATPGVISGWGAPPAGAPGREVVRSYPADVGQPMPETSRMPDFQTWLRDHHVTEIECIVADINGIARGKILPGEKFLRSIEDESLRLPESIFTQTVTGDYPEDAVIAPVARDVRLRPAPASIRLVPWYAEPTAQV